MGSAKLKIAPPKNTKGLYHTRSSTSISTDFTFGRVVSRLVLTQAQLMKKISAIARNQRLLRSASTEKLQSFLRLV